MEAPASQTILKELQELVDGTNWTWFNNRQKLPSTQDSNFFDMHEHDLSTTTMHKIVDQIRDGNKDAMIVLLSNATHD